MAKWRLDIALRTKWLLLYWPNPLQAINLLSWLANYWDMIVIDHMNVLWFFLREFLFQNPEFSSNCYVLQSRHPPHLVEVGRDGSFLYIDSPVLIWPLREYWFRTNPTLFEKEGCVCGIFLIMRQTLLHLVLGICHHKLICGCVLHRSGSLISDIYRHYYYLCYPSTMRVGREVIICYFMEADSSLHVWLRGRDVRCLILKVSSFDLVIRVIYLLFWRYMLLAPIW